ncbi:monocarboxylate transporter 14-like [Aricia agestis]|uniref:monocarboxylate transporter 14-like n=1 Tax=Aricia agestis TaxID=91739 RepID=UPI001C20898B|nr:monocarboxylate transporter 14-like [Aricia agestis]
MVGNEINDVNETKIETGNNPHQDCSRDIKSVKSETSIPVEGPKEASSAVERVKFDLDDQDSIFSSEGEEKIPPIPDGGWGWVVVFAAFTTSACADGLAYSFGVLHEEFTNYFEESQSKTSLIGSLFISLPLISGPIMSALVDRYGCRLMTIVASILSTAGFLLASLSNSVEILCLTLGVISGLSMGILYVTCVVSVAFWFDKRRTLAVSLASCGIGFGTLVYSPMTSYFIQLYDWRNTLVLLAGTILNMCVCGALMRDPDWLIVKEKRERKREKARSRKSSSAGSISSRSMDSVYLTAEELNDLLKSGRSPEYILATLTTSLAVAEQLEATTQMNAEQAHKRINSDVDLPTYLRQNERVPAEVIDKLMSNKSLYNILVHNYSHIISRRKSDVEAPANINKRVSLKVTLLAEKPKEKNEVQNHEITEEPNVANGTTTVEDKAKSVKRDSKREIEKQPKVSHGWFSQLSTDHSYFRNMPLYRNTIMHRSAMMNIPKYKLRAASLPDIYRNSTWSLHSDTDDEKRWYTRISDAFKSVFDIRMFTEFHFLMFNVASLILSVWAIIPYFYLKSYMTDNNIEGGAFMISIIGIASAVGIVVLGWAGDQPWLNVTKAYAVCLCACGVCVGVYPLVRNYWGLAAVSALFGLTYASSYSYTPAILIELVPIDHFTVGYGFILLSQGLGHLLGPPLGGLLYDVTRSWDATFYAGGAWLAAAAACVAVIPYTRNVRLCGRAPLLNDDAQTTVNV